MKLAIVGSRNLEQIKIDKYIPNSITEIVSGGAKGVDTVAKEFAHKSGITYVEFLPKYQRFGKAAPIKRNEEIANYADEALILWDGKSNGTAQTIRLFQKLNKKVTVIIINET